MNRKYDSKREERFHLRVFAKCYSEFPVGRCRYGRPPDPDLVVHTEQGRIGIEHTRLFRIADQPNKPMQRQEALQNRIVTNARDTYRAAGGRDAHLSVYFDDRVTLGKADVAMYSDKLADAMRVIEAELGSHIKADVPIQIHNWEYNRRFPNGLPAGFQLLYFDYVSKPGFECWGVAHGTVVPLLRQDHIQAKIDNKEKRLAGYRANCQQVWLLIVADGSTPSTRFDFPADVRTIPYKSHFDRAFLMESFSNLIVNLSLTR
jgi:hypothetical protein